MFHWSPRRVLTLRIQRRGCAMVIMVKSNDDDDDDDDNDDD